MSLFYIYKLLPARGTVPVAQLSPDGHRVELAASEKAILKILRIALSQGALLSKREGGVLTKEPPKTVEDAILARLKRNIPRPYFVSMDEPKDFTPGYQEALDVTPLEGGTQP